MALQDLTGHSILFVVNTPASPLAGETAFAARLTEAGAAVTFSGGAAAPTNIAGHTMFIASASLLSSDLGAGLWDVEVPGLLTEAYVWDDHGFVNTPGFLASQTQIDIVDSSHYLAAGLSGTGLTVYTSAQNLYYGEGPAAGAQIVATVAGVESQPCLMAFETGAELTSGTAPARRVCLFMHEGWDNTANDNGLLLIDAAVHWVLGLDGPPAAQSQAGRPATGVAAVVVSQAAADEGAGASAGVAAPLASHEPTGAAQTPEAGLAASQASQAGGVFSTQPAHDVLAAAVGQGTASFADAPVAAALGATAAQALHEQRDRPATGVVQVRVSQVGSVEVWAAQAGTLSTQAIAPAALEEGTPRVGAGSASASLAGLALLQEPAAGLGVAQVAQAPLAGTGAPESGVATAGTEDAAEAVPGTGRPIVGVATSTALLGVGLEGRSATAGVVTALAVQVVQAGAGTPQSGVATSGTDAATPVEAGAGRPDAGAARVVVVQALAEPTLGLPAAGPCVPRGTEAVRLLATQPVVPGTLTTGVQGAAAQVDRPGAGALNATASHPSLVTDGQAHSGQGRAVVEQAGRALLVLPLAGRGISQALQSARVAAGAPAAGPASAFRFGTSQAPVSMAALPSRVMLWVRANQLAGVAPGAPLGGQATALPVGAPTDRAPLVVYVDERPEVACL